MIWLDVSEAILDARVSDVIAGHTRRLAARKLGMAEVPVIVLEAGSRMNGELMLRVDALVAIIGLVSGLIGAYVGRQNRALLARSARSWLTWKTASSPA